MNEENGLSGFPLLTATGLANSKSGEKVIERTFNKSDMMMKVAVGAVILGGIVVFGIPAYKKWRKNQYAKKNINNPDVQAAIIIRKAFTKVEFPSILSWVLDDWVLWTEQDELFKIAHQVTDLKKVAQAYNILFDGNLMLDLKGGFSSSEFKKFFEIIQGKDGNPDPTRVIPIGKEVYWAKKANGNILKTAWNSKTNQWERYNEVWKTVSYNEKIGTVYQTAKIANGSRYYIIDGGLFSRGYGVVWDNQLKDFIN